MIPTIPIDRLLAEKADDEIHEAATRSGFLTLSGVDSALGLDAARRKMLEAFTLDEAGKRSCLRNKYDPARPNVYRGYFPPEPEKDALLEGFDLGPDIADPSRAGDGRDPLTEATPRPPLDGFAEGAGHYHATLERLGGVVTASLLRGIGADPALATSLFARSISTLRMFRYPPQTGAPPNPERRVTDAMGRERWVMTKGHTDSGFVTLLWQDNSGGLQARSPEGDWIDVPPAADGLVVNFGQLLGDWSGGRIRATEHRVLGGRAERFSVPFFFEPSVDALIEPLFGGEGESFVYGDFLWARMVKFPNFHGVERRPAA